MTCKDCIHYEACLRKERLIIDGINRAAQYASKFINDKIEVGCSKRENICEFFADRSRFVELPHAEWVEDEDMYGDPIYRCSNCNEHFVLEEGTPIDNCYSYCPNCGAKIEEAEQALKERESNE